MADKLDSYEVVSFRGGISDWDDKGLSGSFKFGSNLNIRKKTDSLTCNQDLVDVGAILESVSSSPSPSSSRSPSSSSSTSASSSRSPSSSDSPSASTSASRSPSASVSPSSSTSPSHSVSPSPSSAAGLTVFTDLILFFKKCIDGKTYGFGDQGKVYKINSDLAVIKVFDLYKPILGACQGYTNNGKVYLYFASQTELYRKEIPGRSDWNDVEKIGDLTNALWHTMIEVNGAVNIANGSVLAYVGYDGTFSDEVLDVIPGNLAKCLIERSGRVIVGTEKTGYPNKGINAMIDSEYPFSQIGDDGELFFSNMVDKLPAKKFPGGGRCNPGGVCNEIDQVSCFEWEEGEISWIDKQEISNMALFGVFGADSGKNGIYSYGRRDKNHPFVMNLEYALEVDEIGAIEMVEGVLYVSYRDGVDYGVKIVDSTKKAIGIYESLDLRARARLPSEITTWPYIELFMAPLPDGASIEFWYKMDKNGDFIQARTADGELSFSKANGKKAVFSIASDGDIFEIKLVLNPINNSSPEIYRIRPYFS